MAAVSTPPVRHSQGKSAPCTAVFESPDESPSSAGAATATAAGTAARRAAGLQLLSLSPEEQAAREKEHREQLVGCDCMPEFRSPWPVENDRFRSVREVRANTPYALPPKKSLESRYLTSYKPAHVQEMRNHLLAIRVAKRFLAARPQLVAPSKHPKQQEEAHRNEAESRLRARLETLEPVQLRMRAELLHLDLDEVDKIIESSTDPMKELTELIVANSSLDSGSSEKTKDDQFCAIDIPATFRGLAYLPTPPKTTSAQFFKRRTDRTSRHKEMPVEFSNRTMAARWQFAAEAREPLLTRLGFPFDKGFIVKVHREHCTAFVEVAPGMTPKQLVDRLRNEPPAGAPFNRLRMGQFLGVPCFARLVLGPHILAEDAPLSAQGVGQNCNLALVYKEKHGTFDLVDNVLAEQQRAEAQSKIAHFSRREEINWGWIGQPDPQVVAQSWFQELLEEQQRVSGHAALLRTAQELHETNRAALAGKKKGATSKQNATRKK